MLKEVLVMLGRTCARQRRVCGGTVVAQINCAK
jgi:hypothetical protein